MNTINRKPAVRIWAALALVAALMSLPAFAADNAGGSNQSQPTPAQKIQQIKQIARGAKEWHNVCGSCHNLRDPHELTDPQWDVAVGQMRVRAHLTAQQARDIRAFLKASN